MKIAALIVACGLLAAVLGLALWAYTPDKPRAEIEAAYGVVPADYRDVAGLRLHLRDTGPRRAPAVILLHGFGSSLETWDAWADALSGPFRVVRFDWPGFGLSGLDPASDYTDARSLVVLGEVMDALGIVRASLVGNSLGGKLAWMFAAQHPERVDKLVLVSPDGFASEGFDYGKAPKVPLMMRLLPYVLPRNLVRMSLAPAFGDPAKISAALVDRYRDFMLAPRIRSAMIARMAQVVLQPPEPALRSIKAPTLIIWGERDGMIPFQNSADYLRLISSARLVAFPDLGHVPQEEAPADSLAPVRAFLLDPASPEDFASQKRDPSHGK